MQKKTKKILLILIIVAIISLLSLGIYFLLDKLNITSISNLRRYINKFEDKSWLVFVVAQVLISTPIFIIPFEDELWVTVALLLFSPKLAFVVCAISTIIVSALLYLMGRILGSKVVAKIVGEEELKSVQEKFSVKSKLSLPIMYFIPFFPHDTLCLVAGISKMNFWYFMLITILIRPIETVCLCFLGAELINWSSLSKFDWIVFINLICIDLFMLKKLQVYMEKKLENKNITETKNQVNNESTKE
ncbi:MAG: TVP38/TMEM64 family protein [Clostridia bacterium]|nr:TVP38/TMEM64 family protein [Clostridia bacterium]